MADEDDEDSQLMVGRLRAKGKAEELAMKHKRAVSHGLCCTVFCLAMVVHCSYFLQSVMHRSNVSTLPLCYSFEAYRSSYSS